VFQHRLVLAMGPSHLLNKVKDATIAHCNPPNMAGDPLAIRMQLVMVTKFVVTVFDHFRWPFEDDVDEY
jgi:hypothetical protein